MYKFGWPFTCLAYALIFNYHSYAQTDEFKRYDLSIEEIEQSIVMIPVKGGRFTLGLDDGNADEKPQQAVEVSDFWMSKYEITWDQYEAFLYRDSENDSFKDEQVLRELGIDGVSGATQPYIDMSFGMGKKNFPVINVTQHAALGFCKWLTAKTGVFYRLPTEAEWEYTCKLGSEQNTIPLDELAWYANNSAQVYHQVGTRDPNSLGIYDLLGNVSEWTLDQYRDSYADFPTGVDPWVNPKSLYPRVVRGGSWQSPANEITCTNRQYSKPAWKRRDPQLPKSEWWHTDAPFVGFRIVRPTVTPSALAIAEYWLEVMDDF